MSKPDQRACSRCRDPKPLDADHFHRKGRVFSSVCKDCANAASRARYHEGAARRPTDRQLVYLRARGRALTRLKDLHPETFKSLLDEEIRADGG